MAGDRIRLAAGLTIVLTEQSLLVARTIGLDTMEELACGCRRGRHSPRRLRGKSSR